MALATERDQIAERKVAEQLETAWGCKLHHYGPFDAVDWWAEKNGRCSAVLELKRRYRDHDKFATACLNLRKWLALTMVAATWGISGLFIIAFDDGLYYVDISNVHAGVATMKVAGRIDRARNDREPTIHIPLELFEKIE